MNTSTNVIDAFLEEYADQFQAFKERFEKMELIKKQEKKQKVQAWQNHMQSLRESYGKMYTQAQPLSIEFPKPEILGFNEMVLQSYTIHWLESFLKEHSIQPITFNEANQLDPSVDTTGWAYNPNRYHEHWMKLVVQLNTSQVASEVFLSRYGSLNLYNDYYFNHESFLDWFMNFFHQALNHIRYNL